MEKDSWSMLAVLVLISTFSLWVGFTTRPGPKTEKDPVYLLRSYARSVGLMIGIGGSIIALRMLVSLLTKGP